jgi:hypothetical protein
MTDYSITEDFPKTEIEFDQRFRDIDACYNYMARFASIWTWIVRSR